MASISRRVLSGSTNGQPIAVVATASPGTSINVASATKINMVTIAAKNTAATARIWTIEWGTTSTRCHIIGTIEAQSGWQILVDNMPIEGTTATIAAFATATSGLDIMGYVDAFT